MAPEWEMPMGMDFGMGMGMEAPYSSTTAPMTAFTNMASPPAYIYGLPTAADGVDDLLDLSNHDLFPSAAASTTTTANAADTQFLAPAEHCSAPGSCLVSGDQTMSASSGFHSQQSSFDLCIPSEEAAELEWLSKFVDDSFSDVPNYQSTWIIPTSGADSGQLRADQSAATGRGARSKRTRTTSGTTAAAAWALALIPQPPSHSSPSSSSSSSSCDFPPSKPKSGACDHNNNSSGNVSAHNGGRGKKGGGGGAGDIGMEGGVRRCTHCASEKTPQWRTGPLGPKTLCNACGVRYKSGRLVPEYRPAASPTFMLTQHSNSHRKVMELRRQKELLLMNTNSSATPSAAAASRPDLLFNDHHYGVC